MDGICSIDFKDHFPAMIGSESYRCDARHRVDERKEKNSQSRTRSVRVRLLANSAIEGQPKRSTQSASTRACHGALRILRKLRHRVREENLEGLGTTTTTTTTTTTFTTRTKIMK